MRVLYAQVNRTDKTPRVCVNLTCADCGELGSYLSLAFMNKQVLLSKFDLQLWVWIWLNVKFRKMIYKYKTNMDNVRDSNFSFFFDKMTMTYFLKNLILVCWNKVWLKRAKIHGIHKITPAFHTTISTERYQIADISKSFRNQ